MPKILAIDDINDNLISLKAIIEDTFPDSVVFTALNGPNGIELASAKNPDVILLDVIMPGMDGFEVCRLLKLDERTCEIPVVFLTALKGDKENRIKALEVGAEGFLSKPIDETELIAQIRAMVKIRAANEQKRDEKARLEKLVEERTRELVQSQAEFKGIFESLQDAYFQADLSGKFTKISPSARRMFGFESPDELIGQPAELLYADPHERAFLMSTLRVKGRIADYVCQGKKKDGTSFWVSVNVQLIRNDEGKIIGTEGLVRDISERKNAEKALKESEEKFEMLFNKAPLGYQSLDIDGRFIEVNQQWLDTLGFSREEVIGKWFGDFLSPDYKEGFRMRFPLFKAQGHIHSEFEMVHKNGTLLFIAFEGKIGYNLDGDFKQTHCILQDITQRKKAEKALEESEEKYRTMVDFLPDGVVIHEGGKLVFANATAIKTVGADSFEQMTERSLLDYVHPDYRTFSLNRIREIYSTGQPSRFSEEKFVNLQDEIFDVEVIGIPVMYMGKPAIQTIIRNITERLKAERAIKESETRLKDAQQIAKIGSFHYDALRDQSWWSDELFKLYGLEPTNKPFSRAEAHAFTHPENKNTGDEMIQQAKDTDAVVENEYKIIRPDGSVRYHSSVSRISKNDSGQIISIDGTVQDITERKQADEKIRESEAQFQEFFEKAADAIFVADIETGIIVDVNEAATRLMNRTYEQLVGIHQSQLHPPVMEKYAKETFKYHKDLVKQKLPSNALENTIVRSDGIEVPVEILAAEVTFKGKRCIHGTFRDITERKKSEKEIQESEAKYRYMFDHNPQPMWIYDHDTLEILEVNYASTKIYGYSRDEFLTMTIKDIRPAEDVALMLRDVEESRLHENSFGEWRHVKKSGEIMNVEISASSIIFKGRKARHVLIIDITERKRAEDAIRKSESLLRTLIESAPFEVWARDKNGYGILENKNTIRHFGSILGKNPDHEGISPQINQLWNSNNKRVMSGEIVDDECVYLVDGVKRHFHQILAPIIVDGSLEGITGFNIDITERKVAEELLRESEYFFRESQRAAFVGSYKFDIVADQWTSSEVLDQIFGIDKNCTKSHQSWIDIIHPDDREMMAQYFNEEVVGNRQPFNKEYRINSQKDSETRWVLGLGKLKLDAEDHVVEMIGTIQDITERVLAQQALNEKTQLFQELFNASPDAILLIDPHHPQLPWTIVDCNKAACLMNGYTREELIGKSIDLLNNQDGTPEERQNYLLNLRQKGIIHGEFIHRNKDGRIFPVETSTSLICIEGRELILGIDRDTTERKRAERIIKESEERYRSFISQVSEGVYRFESDEPMDISLPIEEQIDFVYDHFTLAECNQAFLMMYGSTNEQEILGKGSLDFHGGRNNPINRETFRTFINNGYRTQNAITQETNSVGKTIYFNNNSLGIIENEKLIRLWGTQTDVTEKIRADQIQQVLYTISNAAFSTNNLNELIEIISKEVGKLIDSINFYIAFYDEPTNMLSTIYERDEKDAIETWPADNSITGYVIKQQKSLLLREEDVDQFYSDSGIQQFGTPAKVWLGVPLTTNKKTIGAIVVQSYVNPDAYTEKDKQMLEFISHQISISIERKQTEAEIIEKELQYRNLADSGMALIWTADTDKLCKYFNKPWLEFTGRTFEQEYGFGWADGVHPDDLDRCVKTYQIAFDKRESFEMEYRLRHVSGEYRWLLDLGSPNYNSEGKFIGYIGHCFDITDLHQIQIDLRNAKEKAEESDRLKSSFLANMSHEIRTPLNSIIGFSELLLDEAFGPEHHAEFARTINSSGNGLLTIISDIMDLSKIESGQVQVKKQSFSVTSLVNEIQKEYSYKALEKGIELRLDPENPKDDFFIESDEQRLRQILINFVGNAIKFTEKGFIQIGFGLESNRDKASQVPTLRFFVKDTGIGIPQEYHQKIFERFRQVEISHTRKYGGNGLGLAISKNLVEMLGGKIGLESEKEKGSTFYFTIPVS